MRKQDGFTLVELMITLAIASILLTVGVPSFRDFILNNRIITQANRFASDVALARSTAIKYQRSTSICISNNSDAANPTCTAGTTDWSNGWIVWVDKDRDATVDAPGEILRRGEALEGTTTFTSTAANSFTFNSRGFATTTDTLSLCDDRTGETGRNIDIRDIGRINISNLAC